MNPIRAKEILIQFKQRAENNKPLSCQLDSFFIPSLWNDNAYLRDSLLGRITSSLYYPIEAKNTEKKLKIIFKDAIARVEKTEIDLTIAKLHDELLRDDPEEHNIVEPQAELAELSKAQEQIKVEQAQRLINLSFFRTIFEEERPEIDLDSFKTLFDLKNLEDDFLKSLEYFKKIKKDFPQYASPNFDEWAILLESAASRNQLIQAALLAEEKNSSKNEILKHYSQQIVDELIQMKIGGDHKKIIFLSYGNKHCYGSNHLKISSLFEILKQLPEEVLSKLPPPFQEFIQKGTAPDMKKLAGDLVHWMVETALKESEQFYINEELPSSASHFFKDNQRYLSEKLSSLLPNFLVNHLENILQGGILQTADQIFTPSEWQDISENLVEHGGKLLTNEGKIQLAQTIEEKLTKFLEEFIQKQLTQVENQCYDFQNKFAKIFPPQLIEILGMNQIFKGPIWLEIEKCEDGTFNLNMHSSGIALKNHPKDPSTNHPYHVLRLSEIDKKNLNPDFFLTLLARHFEPHWNPERTSTADDIYSGPIETLNGKRKLNLPEDPIEKEFANPTEWSMARTYLLKPDHDNFYPLFEVYFDSLLNFCRPFLTREDQSLQVPEKAKEILKIAIIKIRDEMAKMSEGTLKSERFLKIEATLKEVEGSIDLNEIQSLTEIKEIFSAHFNISYETVKYYANFLEWALGKEVGEFLSYLLQPCEKILPSKSKEMPNKNEIPLPQEGWLTSYYIGIYFNLGKKIAKIAMMASGIFMGGAWNLLSIPMFLSWLPYLLPPKAYAWYRRVTDALKLALAQAMLKAIWKFYLNDSNREIVLKSFEKWKAKIASLNDFKKNYNKVSFKLGQRDETLPPSPLLPETVPKKIKPSGKFVDLESFRPLPSSNNGISSLALDPSYGISNITAYLHSLFLSANVLTDLQSFTHICEGILRLETPSLTTKTLWDSIVDVDDTLYYLARVGSKLMDVYKFSSHTEHEVFATHACAMYQLQAIMFCLAKRDPHSCLTHFKINAVPLIKFYQLPGVVISSPKIVDRIKALCAYLMPDLDPDHPYTLEELNSYASNTLFDYTSGNSINGSGNFSEAFINGKLHHISSAENEYMEELLKDPSIKLKFSKLHLSEQLTDYKLKLLLFIESLTFLRKEPIVPLSVCYLKLLTLFCNKFMSGETSLAIAGFSFGGIFGKKGLDYPAKFSFTKEIKILGLTFELNDFNLLKSFVESNRILFLDCFHPRYLAPMDSSHPFNSPSEKTQTKIREKTFPTDSFDFEEAFLDVDHKLEMSHCEISERIITFINYVDTLATLKPFKLLFECKKYPYNTTVDTTTADKIFFAPGALKKQIEKSPQSIKAIGEFFERTLHRTLQSDYFLDIFNLGIRVKAHCTYFDRETAKYFPNFQNLLELFKNSYEKAEDHKQILPLLNALADVYTINDNQPSEIEKGMITLLGSWFNNDFADLTCKLRHRCCFEYYHMVLKWLPSIQKLLWNPSSRNQLLDNLMKKKGVYLKKEKCSWEETSPGIFVKNGITVNFINAQISGAPYLGVLEFLKNSKRLNSIISTNHLKVIDEGIYESDNGTRFSVILNDNIFLIKFLSTPPPNLKHLQKRINSQSLEQNFVPISMEEPDDNEYINLSLFKKDLNPLSRFLPIEKMVCIYNRKLNIKCLVIVPDKLEFEIKKTADGSFKAYSTIHSGFKISESQEHLVLEGFSSYLLLDSDFGTQKKVFIKKKLHISAFVSRLTSLAGPISTFLLDQWQQKEGLLSDDFYEYDISISSNGKWSLQTSDPQALAYLLVHFCLQGKNMEAKECFHKLHELLNLQLAPIEIVNELYILALMPLEWGNIGHYRRILFSTIEKNRLIFPRNCDKDKYSEKDLIIAAALMWDLLHYDKNANSSHILTINQEFFLYKSAFYHLKQVLQHYLASFPKIIKYFDDLGWDDILEFTFLTPRLQKRYEQLKKEAGIEDSLFYKSIKFIAKVVKTPSSVSNNLINCKYDQEPFSSQEEFCKILFRFIQKLRESKFTNVSYLNVNDLFLNALPGIFPYPPIEPQEISSDNFKKYFITYYSLARGDYPYKKPLERKPSFPTKEKLAHFLKLNKGGFDNQTYVLFSFLEAVMSIPSAFPPTDELVNAKNVIQWRAFFQAANDTSLNILAIKEFVDPMCENLSFFTNNYLISRILISPLRNIPGIKDNSLAYFTSELAARSSSRAISNGLQTNFPQAKQWMPTAGKIYFNDSELSSKIGKGAFYISLYAGGIFLLNYGAEQVSSLINPLFSASLDIGTIGTATQVGLWALSFAGAGGLQYLYAKKTGASLTLRDVMPLPSVTIPAVNIASKAYNAFNADEKIEKDVVEINTCEKIEINREALIAIDQLVDQFLDGLFNYSFIENREPLEETRFEFLEPREGDSPVMLDRYDRVNKSIGAYYDLPDRQKPLYILKNKDSLGAIYNSLLMFQLSFSKQMDLEQKQLKNIFAHAKLKDLAKIIEKNAFEDFVRLTKLPEGKMGIAKQALAKIYLGNARLHQIDRLIAILRKISFLDESAHPLEYFQNIERLAIELKNRTAFDLINTPISLLMGNLLFQMRTKSMLWPRQAMNQEKILQSSGNVVSEQAPGDGKTHFTIPETAFIKSDGKQGVVTLITTSLAGEHQPKIAHKLRFIFNKISHALTFNRQVELDLENLKGLAALISFSISSGEPIHMKKEDALALCSIFDELAMNYCKNKSFQNKETKKKLILLHQVLSSLYHNTIFLADEAHEIYKFRHQLNYPVGKIHTIPRPFYYVNEIIFREIYKDCEMIGLIKNGQLSTLSDEDYSKIKKRLAKRIAVQKRFNLRDKKRRDEFVDYVCDKAHSIPAWLNDDYSFFQNAALAKGILGILLPMTFPSRVDVDFMASKKGNGGYARPADGNSHVQEQDSIQLPYETLVKTFLMVLKKGLKDDEVELVMNLLKANAEKEMEKFKVPFQGTRFFKRFSHLFCKNPSIDNFLPKIGSKKFLDLKNEPEIGLHFVRHFIWKDIQYWKKSIQKTSQHLAMFQTNSYTGTPHNDGTYPAKLITLRDPAIIGEMLHIINQKCGGIHLLQTLRPLEILDEILLRFFLEGSTFSAIIDGGAQFTGMDNLAVAKRIMEFCLRHRPDIEAVKFFQEVELGKEKVFCLIRGANDPLLAETLKINASKCITYYDQRHGFGTDEEQTGDGFVTLGPNHPLFKWLQEVFRIRPLKKQNQLSAIGDVLISMPMQKIHFGMTKEIQRRIMKDKNDTLPVLKDIVEYVVRNEGEIPEKENYESMGQKINAVPMQVVYKKIWTIPSPNFKHWMAVWKEHIDLIITRLEVDPVKLFGSLKVEIETSIALDDATVKSFKSIEKRKTLSDADKSEVKNELDTLPRPVLNLKVTAWRNKRGDLEMGAINSLSVQQTVEVSNHQHQSVDVDQEDENQQEVDLQQNVHCTVKNQRLNYNEMNWPRILDPASLDWLNFCDPSKPFTSNICPFFTVQDLLTAASSPALRDAAPYFDKRLWMSNNFVPRMLEGRYTKPVDIGSSMQFELFQVLVHFTENKGEFEVIFMTPLSLKDTGIWRKKLTCDPTYWSNEEVKVILWDIHTSTIQAGCPISQEKLKQDDTMNLLIGQLKLLDGQVDYKNETEAIQCWLKEKKNDPAIIKEAFLAIHASRGKQQFHGSTLDFIFLDAMPESYEEDL